MDLRAYRQWRERRREAEATRTGESRPDKEAKELLEFARKWEPFGGAPADEVFVRFGLSPRRFAQRLREALPKA